MQRLAQVVVDRHEALTEENRSLKASKRRIEELDKALKNSQYDHQKTKVGLTNMREENIFLCKELSTHL